MICLLTFETTTTLTKLFENVKLVKMMKYKTGELKELVKKLIDSLKKITLREWDAVQKQESVLANCLSHEEGRLRGFKLPGLTLNTAHFKCIKGKFYDLLIRWFHECNNTTNLRNCMLLFTFTIYRNK